MEKAKVVDRADPTILALLQANLILIQIRCIDTDIFKIKTDFTMLTLILLLLGCALFALLFKSIDFFEKI